ncbi:hypothetical protein HPB47_016569 [Ixodes persulcatus]|uniref:Uncharacterized protein n=1 Tax=Ixodes persulcatus TaxID=34615 RepID=A0AC60QU95_IXOPE|nr:hypothetical protein HPB47_016569 [Ixodes persulcatus]
MKVATAHLFLVLAVPLWLLCARVTLLIQCAQSLGLLILTTLVSYWTVWILRRNLFHKLVGGDGKAVLITGDASPPLLHAPEMPREKASGKEDVTRVSGTCWQENWPRRASTCLPAVYFSDGNDAKKLRSSSNIHVLQLDVTKEDQVELALEEVKNKLDSRVLWSVVANAGMPNMGPVEWQTMARIRSVFEVNVFGVVHVAKTFLPLLKNSGGRLVIVSSGLGRVTFPPTTIYCMTKHACISLADGLRRQYYDQGIHVSTIEPWAYRTKMLNTDQLEATLDADMKNLPADVQRSVCEVTLTRVKCLISGFLNGAAREDPNEVVHEMALAVRESTPKAYYMAGGHVDCLVRWLFGVVPAELTDAWLSAFL